MPQPADSLKMTPCQSAIVARTLARFSNCVLDWLLETSNPSTNLAKRENHPPSYEERLELCQIAGEINSLILGSFRLSPEKIREWVDECTERIHSWAGDISARQLCAFMLNEVRIALNATTPPERTPEYLAPAGMSAG